MAPCTRPGKKRLFCLEARYGLGRFAPTALPPYNAVRGHGTGPNISGAEDYLRSKKNKRQKILSTTTDTNRISQTKIKR